MPLTLNVVFDKATVSALSRIAAGVESIAREIHKAVFRLSSPGPLRFKLTGEKGTAMGDVISFKVVLPTLADESVVSRELTVTVGDAAPVVQTVDKAATEVDGLSGAQDATFTLSLVDIDEAGNRSQPSTLTDVLKDVFPPATPGVLSIAETGETRVADPVAPPTEESA